MIKLLSVYIISVFALSSFANAQMLEVATASETQSFDDKVVQEKLDKIPIKTNNSNQSLECERLFRCANMAKNDPEAFQKAIEDVNSGCTPVDIGEFRKAIDMGICSEQGDNL